MLFWPVIMVPSERPAEMWWEKLELMAGITFTCLCYYDGWFCKNDFRSRVLRGKEMYI